MTTNEFEKLLSERISGLYSAKNSVKVTESDKDYLNRSVYKVEVIIYHGEVSADDFSMSFPMLNSRMTSEFCNKFVRSLDQMLYDTF